MMKQENKCPVSRYCGGCQLQGVSYEKQLQQKQESIQKLLSAYCKVDPILGMENPLHYRNKVQVSFGYDEKHHILCGNYVSSTHTIVPVDECMICDKKANEIISSFKKLLIHHKISIFDESSMKGCIRHLLIRCNHKGEYMLVIVTGSERISKKDELIADILKYNPCVTTMIQNINRKRTSMVLGDRNYTLYGKGYIIDDLCGLKFRISPSSFYQVNQRQTEVLYNTAIRLADLKKEDILIDAYCGTGTIGLSASRYVKKVYGVESNRSAIKDANTNKKLNEIENAEFICEDAGKYMEYLSKNKTHIDTVIMDPPRAGADFKFMSSMVRMSPDKIIYISCNPITLKDNLKYLRKYYTVKKIQPVDMFPYTQHIETIVLLQKLNS